MSCDEYCKIIKSLCGDLQNVGNKHCLNKSNMRKAMKFKVSLFLFFFTFLEFYFIFYDYQNLMDQLIEELII